MSVFPGIVYTNQGYSSHRVSLFIGVGLLKILTWSKNNAATVENFMHFVDIEEP